MGDRLGKRRLFGAGWHLFGIGSSAYSEAADAYVEPSAIVEAFETAAEEAGLEPSQATELTTTAYIYNDEDGVLKRKFP